MQTSVVASHIVAIVLCEGRQVPRFPTGPMDLDATRVRRSRSFSPAIRFQPLFLPESRNKNRCATRVQGLSLGVLSPSPRLSALRAQTGAGQFGATAISSNPFNQEGKRKSEACLNQKLRGYYE